MLSELALTLFKVSATFFTLGLFMGNLALIYLGLIPLVYSVLGLYLDKPHGVSISVSNDKLTVNVNKELTVGKEVQVSEGIGFVLFSERLDDVFEITQGSNLDILFKGVEKINKTLEYNVTASKRGVYSITNMEIESPHLLNLETRNIYPLKHDRSITVKPNITNFHILKHRKIMELVPVPIDNKIKLGTPTTEFKEIRKYNYGDSYRQINWKASAKTLSLDLGPMVNEFEKEGKKVVWIFIDAGKDMRLGASNNNIFEYSVEAATSLSTYYLNKQCQVGLGIYNSDVFSRVGDKNRIMYDNIPAWFIADTKPMKKKEKDLRWVCKRCGLKFLPEPPRYSCPACRSNTTVPLDSRAEKEQPRVTPPPLFSDIDSISDFLLYSDMGKRQQYKIWKLLLDAEISAPTHNLLDLIQSCRTRFKGTAPLFIILTSVNENNWERVNSCIKEFKKYLPRMRFKKYPILLLHISGYGLLGRNNSERFAAKLLEMKEDQRLDTLRSQGIRVVNWRPSSQSLAEVFLRQV